MFTIEDASENKQNDDENKEDEVETKENGQKCNLLVMIRIQTFTYILQKSQEFTNMIVDINFAFLAIYCILTITFLK